MISQLMKGRLLTIINRTSRTIGAVGLAIPPGKSKSVQLSKVQTNRIRGKDLDLDAALNNQKYMDELEILVKSGQAALSVDGVPLHWDTDAPVLDAPLDAKFQVVRETWTNLLAADVNAIKEAFTAPVAATTYLPATFDGVVGPGTMVPPRNFTIKGTTGVGEALASKAVVITGLDLDGQIRTETITTTVLGASSTVTDAGTIAWRQILSVYVPADASPVLGDYEFGFGVKIGLSHPLTMGAMFAEFANNALDLVGTVALSSVSAPNGTLILNTTPNGTNDYVVVYVPN
jgi:hypothetical protein